MISSSFNKEKAAGKVLLLILFELAPVSVLALDPFQLLQRFRKKYHACGIPAQRRLG